MCLAFLEQYLSRFFVVFVDANDIDVFCCFFSSPQLSNDFDKHVRFNHDVVFLL